MPVTTRSQTRKLTDATLGIPATLATRRTALKRQRRGARQSAEDESSIGINTGTELTTSKKKNLRKRPLEEIEEGGDHTSENNRSRTWIAAPTRGAVPRGNINTRKGKREQQEEDKKEKEKKAKGKGKGRKVARRPAQRQKPQQKDKQDHHQRNSLLTPSKKRKPTPADSPTELQTPLSHSGARTRQSHPYFHFINTWLSSVPSQYDTKKPVMPSDRRRRRRRSPSPTSSADRDVDPLAASYYTSTHILSPTLPPHAETCSTPASKRARASVLSREKAKRFEMDCAVPGIEFRYGVPFAWEDSNRSHHSPPAGGEEGAEGLSEVPREVMRAMERLNGCLAGLLSTDVRHGEDIARDAQTGTQHAQQGLVSAMLEKYLWRRSWRGPTSTGRGGGGSGDRDGDGGRRGDAVEDCGKEARTQLDPLSEMIIDNSFKELKEMCTSSRIALEECLEENVWLLQASRLLDNQLDPLFFPPADTPAAGGGGGGYAGGGGERGRKGRGTGQDYNYSPTHYLATSVTTFNISTDYLPLHIPLTFSRLLACSRVPSITTTTPVPVPLPGGRVDLILQVSPTHPSLPILRYQISDPLARGDQDTGKLHLNPFLEQNVKAPPVLLIECRSASGTVVSAENQLGLAAAAWLNAIQEQLFPEASLDGGGGGGGGGSGGDEDRHEEEQLRNKCLLVPIVSIMRGQWDWGLAYFVPFPANTTPHNNNNNNSNMSRARYQRNNKIVVRYCLGTVGDMSTFEGCLRIARWVAEVKRWVGEEWIPDVCRAVERRIGRLERKRE